VIFNMEDRVRINPGHGASFNILKVGSFDKTCLFPLQVMVHGWIGGYKMAVTVGCSPKNSFSQRYHTVCVLMPICCDMHSARKELTYVLV